VIKAHLCHFLHKCYRALKDAKNGTAPAPFQ
jgi:hypothetical protein